MSNLTFDSATMLKIRRYYHASRERVFRAWTNPEQLKQWFAVAEGFTTPIADVDLKVGGRYRLGMQPPGDDGVLIAGGVYQQISPPEKLVFTWRWGWLRSLVLAWPALFRLFGQLPGLEIDAAGKNGQFFISFV